MQIKMPLIAPSKQNQGIMDAKKPYSRKLKIHKMPTNASSLIFIKAPSTDRDVINNPIQN